jgi:TRAP-type uncharacterized transport system fused permease subunit
MDSACLALLNAIRYCHLLHQTRPAILYFIIIVIIIYTSHKKVRIQPVNRFDPDF